MLYYKRGTVYYFALLLLLTERIEDYNVLHSMLTDFQTPSDHTLIDTIYEKTGGRVGALGYIANTVQGTNTALAADNAGYSGIDDRIFQKDNYAAVLDSSDNTVLGIQSPVPKIVNLTTAGVTTGATLTRSNATTVGIKLCSGLLRNQRYIPLLALKGAGLTLELTIANCSNFIVSNAVCKATLSDVEYVASTIDFDEVFTQTFRGMIAANTMIQMHGVSYNSFVWSYSAAGTVVIPIALRARSLKGIMCGMRKQSQINDIDSFSLSRRYNAGLEQYVFSVGSIRLPQAPVKIASANGHQGMTEAYCEILKMFGSFTDLHTGGRVSLEAYYDSGFAIGVDTETYSQDTSILESGLDTSSQSLPVRLELTYASSPTVRITGSTGYALGEAMANRLDTAGSAATYRADIYGFVDVIYSITSEGLLTASD